MTFHSRISSTALGIAAATALLLSSCGGDASSDTSGDPTPAPSESASESSQPEASGELTVWTEDYYVKIFEPLVEPWAQETGIDVEFVTKDFTAMTDQFITAVPAGEGPDLFIAGAATNRLVDSGVIAPVELGDAVGDFAEVAIDAFSSDGQLYGVPFTVENLAMYRNTALAPTAPATWDEAMEIGEQLVADGAADSPFAVGQDPAAGNPYMLMPFMSSFGSTIFAQDDAGTFDPEQLTIDDEQGQAFATWLAGAAEAGQISPDMTLDIALEQFKTGRTPFLVTGPWDLSGIQDSGVEYAIEPIPSAGGEFASPFVSNYGVYQSAETDNPIAASLFLTDFMTRVDTQVGIWQEGKNPPALLPAFDEVSSDPDVQAFGEIGQQAVLVPGIPAMDEVWGPWGETQIAIQRGQGDPVELWNGMADRIREAIAGG